MDVLISDTMTKNLNIENTFRALGSTHSSISFVMYSHMVEALDKSNLHILLEAEITVK